MLEAAASETGAVLGHRLATYPCTPVDGSSASTSLRLGDRSRTPTRRSVSSGPVGLIAGSWSTAALAMRCETAPLHYDLRHSCRKQSRSAARWRSNAGAPYRIRTRGSYDLRACGTAFCEPAPHPPLAASPLLTRQPRHLPRLLRRRLGACHNRHHIRYHLLGALDLAASDVAEQPSSETVAIGDPPGDSCKAICGRAKPPRQRNVHSVLTQDCLGMKSATRKKDGADQRPPPARAARRVPPGDVAHGRRGAV